MSNPDLQRPNRVHTSVQPIRGVSSLVTIMDNRSGPVPYPYPWPPEPAGQWRINDK